MALDQYKVVHKNHAGIALGEVFPEGLEFAIYLSDIGYTNYAISLENPLATRAFTNPYVTDYELWFGSTQIQGGMHTDIDMQDVQQRVMQVSGKEWKHYLDKREWDFDPANPGGNLYLAFQEDLLQIVRDLCNQMMLDANSLVISYDNPGQLSGTLANYQILPQDTETIYSKINTLAASSPGFDWEVTLGKVLKLYTPFKGITNTNFMLELGKNCEQFNYGEQGITGTKVLGLGAGTSGQVATLLEDTTASQKYRRLDQSRDFGSVNSQTLLDQLTAAELQRDKTPLKVFSCVYVPNSDDSTFSFWTDVAVGDIIEVKADLSYDVIDDWYRLVGILSQPTDEGDQQITLTFDDATLSL